MLKRSCLLSLSALAALAGCPTDDGDETGTSAATEPTTGEPTTGAPTTGPTTDPETATETDGTTIASDTEGTDTADTDTDTGTDTDTDTAADSTGENAGCGMPVELGHPDLGELEVDGFHVNGTQIAVALRGDGVGLLDATDPAAIALLGSLDTEGGPVYRVATDGTRVLGGRRGGGAVFVDASSPAAMTEFWNDDSLDTEDVVFEGNELFLASPAGISIVDVTLDDDPMVLVTDLQQDAAGLNIGGSTLALGTTDVAYMAGFNFTSIDIGDRSAPATLAEVDDTGRPGNIVYANDFVYVGGSDGVQIFDVADPSAPSLVGTYEAQRAEFVAVDADNDRMFVLGSSTSSTDVPFLRIVDVADKTAPVEIGTLYDELDDPRWVQFAEGRLYFSTEATDPPSLYVLDACPPA